MHRLLLRFANVPTHTIRACVPVPCLCLRQGEWKSEADNALNAAEATAASKVGGLVGSQ